MNVSDENKKQVKTMYENFRLLRKEKGWTIEELSEKSGISVEDLTCIEREEDFNVDFLIVLCRIYGIKPHEIFLPIDIE